MTKTGHIIIGKYLCLFQEKTFKKKLLIAFLHFNDWKVIIIAYLQTRTEINALLQSLFSFWPECYSMWYSTVVGGRKYSVSILEAVRHYCLDILRGNVTFGQFPQGVLFISLFSASFGRPTGIEPSLPTLTLHMVSQQDDSMLPFLSLFLLFTLTGLCGWPGVGHQVLTGRS